MRPRQKHPPPSRAGESAAEIFAQTLVRLEFIITIVLDAGVVLTALWARSLIVALAERLSPTSPHTWATAALERIGDIGIVAAAAAFATFDFLKRLIIAWRSLARTWRGDE